MIAGRKRIPNSGPIQERQGIPGQDRGYCLNGEPSRLPLFSFRVFRRESANIIPIPRKQPDFSRERETREVEGVNKLLLRWENALKERPL
jgi:hypothetical protein